MEVPPQEQFAQQMFTAEDMLNVVSVGPPNVSNDGAVLATITVVWDPQSGRHSSSIWVMEVAGEWVQRLTDPRQVVVQLHRG